MDEFFRLSKIKDGKKDKVLFSMNFREEIACSRCVGYFGDGNSKNLRLRCVRNIEGRYLVAKGKVLNEDKVLQWS